MASRYRLKLKRLDFISAVDQPAQETAKVLLIKRRNVADFARVAKVDEELGLVFCWAFTSKKGGADYYDLQGDAIDEDFVKAAAEFMQGGGVTDQMHDETPDGRVVFAMPMTSEIAKAFGVATETTGLMIALKPSAAALAKFKSGEYTGVSIGGLGERIAAKRAARKQALPTTMLVRRVVKEAVLTSEEDGHQHAIDLDDPSEEWMDTYTTSWQTADGAPGGHSHTWTFDPDSGAITIGSDSGHSHTVDVSIPADVLAAYAALDAEEDAENLAIADGVPAEIADEPSSGKTIINVIAARAPASKSTLPIAVPTVGVMADTSDTKTAELEKKIDALTKRAEQAERLSKLSDAHKIHLAKLSPEDGEKFLAKTHAERDAVLAEIEKANDVVYTSESDGTVYRKSDDSRLVAMAKREDSRVKEVAKATALLEQERLEKRAASEIGALAGDAIAKVALLRAVDSIKDDAQRAAVIVSLKAADVAVREFNKFKGVAESGIDIVETPLAKFEKGLAVFAKSVNKTPRMATSEYLGTQEGAELYAAFTERQSA